MNVLHLSPSHNGYQVVKLLKNRISEKNQLGLIVLDGKEMMTGGLLLKDTPEIRKILNFIPKEKQYEIIRDIKETPFCFEESNETE